MLKIKHLNKNVRVVIVVVSKFMNEIEKSLMNLISIIYDLNEKKFNKIMITTFANIIENLIDIVFDIIIVNVTIEFANNEFVNDAFVNDAFAINAFKNETFQTKLINRIRQIYLNDIILQRIMKIKKNIFKRISTNIIKKRIKFELENCEIEKNFF